MVHDGVEAADVSEHEVEEVVGEDTLHEADEVLAEGDSLVAAVALDGLEDLSAHYLGLLNLEEGVDAVKHARVDEVRGNGGYLDGALGAVELYAEALAPANGGPLGSGIQRHLGEGQHAGRRCDVADMARSALLHVLEEAERHKHGTLGIDVEGTVDVFVGLLRKHLVVGDDTGVVDEDIYGTAGGLGGFGGDVDGFGAGDIGLVSIDLAQGRKFLHRGGDGFFVDVPDDYLFGAFFQAAPGHNFPNPGAGTGDENGFICNFHCSGFSLRSA